MEPRERDACVALAGLLFEAEHGVNPLLVDLTDAVEAWRAGFYCPPAVSPAIESTYDE